MASNLLPQCNYLHGITHVCGACTDYFISGRVCVDDACSYDRGVWTSATTAARRRLPSSSTMILSLKWTRPRPSHPVKLLTSLFRRYGPPKFPLPRTVIERGILKEASLELHPPKFHVYLLVPESIPGQTVPVKTVTVSSTDKVNDACRVFAEAFASDKALPGLYRVWRIPSNAASDGMLFSASTLRTCGAMLLDDEQGSVEEEFVDSGEGFAVEFMSNATWVVNAAEISTTPVPVPPPPPTQSAPLFNTGNDFFSKMGTKSMKSSATATTAPSPFGLSNSQANVNKQGSSTRTKLHEPGTMGLGNM